MILLLVAALAAHDTPVRTDVDTVVRVGEDAIEVECVVVLSRAAAFIEAVEMDADGDGRLSPEEQAATFARAARRIEEGLEILVNGERVRPDSSGEVELEMPFTKRFRFRISHPSGWREGAVIELHNECFLDRSGEVTMEVVAGDGVDVRVRGGERDAVVRYEAGTGQWEEAEEAVVVVPIPSASPWLPAAVVLSLIGLAVAGRGRRRVAIGAGAVVVAVGFVVSRPTVGDSEAEAIFRGLHEQHVRGEAAEIVDGSRYEVRRIKPLETEVLGSTAWSGPEFRVRHRWREYGIESHETHRHARAEEREAVYTIEGRDGAWRIAGFESVRETPITAGR